MSEDVALKARRLGMDWASVEREASAMGLEVAATLLRYARDYVDAAVGRRSDGAQIRLDYGGGDP